MTGVQTCALPICFPVTIKEAEEKAERKKQEKEAEEKEFARLKQRFMARDNHGQLVFLADSAFTIHMTQEKFPNVKLHFISEWNHAK